MSDRIGTAWPWPSFGCSGGYGKRVPRSLKCRLKTVELEVQTYFNLYGAESSVRFSPNCFLLVWNRAGGSGGTQPNSSITCMGEPTRRMPPHSEMRSRIHLVQLCPVITWSRCRLRPSNRSWLARSWWSHPIIRPAATKQLRAPG